MPAELGAEIQIVDEGIEDIDLNREADLIGITVITGSARRAYELSAHFRERGARVVLGAPAAAGLPMRADDRLRVRADCRVRPLHRPRGPLPPGRRPDTTANPQRALGRRPARAHTVAVGFQQGDPSHATPVRRN